MYKNSYGFVFLNLKIEKQLVNILPGYHLIKKKTSSLLIRKLISVFFKYNENIFYIYLFTKSNDYRAHVKFHNIVKLHGHLVGTQRV